MVYGLLFGKQKIINAICQSSTPLRLTDCIYYKFSLGFINQKIIITECHSDQS